MFGLIVFGVNLTQLAPGAWPALHHRHGKQDKFIYVVEGMPRLVRRRAKLDGRGADRCHEQCAGDHTCERHSVSTSSKRVVCSVVCC